METYFGPRDGHCQHNKDHGAAFAKMPGWRNPWAGRAPGSWHPQEMEANPASPLPCSCSRFPGQKNRENLPKHALQQSQVAAACPKEGEDEHRWMGMERGTRGQDGRTHARTHIPVQWSINQRMGAREILRRPERASHPSENTMELRKEPSKPLAAGLIHQVLIALQICLFLLSSETGSQKCSNAT